MGRGKAKGPGGPFCQKQELRALVFQSFQVNLTFKALKHTGMQL